MDLPVAWANCLSILGFLFLAVVVWVIPRKIIYHDAPDNARWRYVRIWANVLITMQLFLYAVFT